MLNKCFLVAPLFGLKRKKKKEKKINYENRRENQPTVYDLWSRMSRDRSSGGREDLSGGLSDRSRASLKRRIPIHVVCPDSCVQVSVGSEKNSRYDTTTPSVPRVEEEKNISENLHTHTHVFTSHQQTYHTCPTDLWRESISSWHCE